MRFLLFLTLTLFIASCDEDNMAMSPSQSTKPCNVSCELSEQVIGRWQRVIANSIWQGRDLPAKEMGETHFYLTFDMDGSFSYHTITLGIYENTLPTDTSAWVNEVGTYVISDQDISIDLQDQIWWDAFYTDMIYPDTLEVIANGRFDETSVVVENDILHLSYVSNGWEGLELSEEEFIRVIN